MSSPSAQATGRLPSSDITGRPIEPLDVLAERLARFRVHLGSVGRITSRFDARLSHFLHSESRPSLITNRRGARLDRTRPRGTRAPASVPATATTRRAHRTFASLPFFFLRSLVYDSRTAIAARTRAAVRSRRRRRRSSRFNDRRPLIPPHGQRGGRRSRVEGPHRAIAGRHPGHGTGNSRGTVKPSRRQERPPY